MPDKIARLGGCACGAVRFQATGEPLRVSACHCRHCQRRTGSAFGIGCYFPRENVTVLSGTMQTYERGSDAGRWIRNKFCGVCGTTVMWEAEALPSGVALAAGTFDNTDWIAPDPHTWTSSAQKWVRHPDDVDVQQQSDFGRR